MNKLFLVLVFAISLNAGCRMAAPPNHPDPCRERALEIVEVYGEPEEIRRIDLDKGEKEIIFVHMVQTTYRGIQEHHFHLTHRPGEFNCGMVSHFKKAGE